MNGFESKQFGKYYLIEKLAVGGMAEIYKAKTFGVDGFEKLLAIKRILPHCAADKDFITMLIDEAKLSVLLSHANIVQVYDLGKIGDDYFISMEYIHGVNLRDIVYRCRESQRPVSAEIAVYIISEVSKGLDYAHRKSDLSGQPLNIVHRDISPQNILISYEGEVKIVDFGIAKAAMNISHTMAGILKGKIAYMSPEQALGKAIDYRTDIFSTGILLYEMLTNTRLFTGESQFEVLKKIRTSRIDAASLPASIPEALREVVAKVLAYRPEDRYQTAADLQIELTKYLYSTYLDFSPRKLAAFVKELFTTEIKSEQFLLAREAAFESQTSSMNVSEGAKQLELVHRDLSITPVTREVTASRQPFLETMVTPLTGTPEKEVATERKRVAKKEKARWPRVIGAGVLAVALIYGAFRFIPGIRFWEHKVAPEVAATAGTVDVTSVPDGAKILMSGQDTGLVTPATISSLSLNSPYVLRLEKDEFKPQERAFRLASTAVVPIQMTLEKMGGILNVISDPPGAAILLDGRATGRVTPATVEDIPLGVEHRVTLSKPEYEDFEQVINLTDAVPQRISTILKAVVAKTGSLMVSSQPSGAQIALNGQDTGRTTPATIANLKLNQDYAVKLSKEGFEAWTKTLTLASAQPLSVEGQLKEMAAPPTPPPTTPTTPTTTPLPPEAAKGEETGSLQITSTPPGAKILLDGKATRKQTPATLQNLKVGKSYTVGLSKTDFEHWTKKITVASAKPIAVEGQLKETQKPTEEAKPPPSAPAERTPEAPAAPAATSGEPAQIRIASNPSGAQVFINSEFKGTTPLTASVSPGSVSVLVSKEGLSRYSKKITVRPGEKVNLTDINLQDVYGEVSLSSTPQRANIVFDGQAIPAKTPVTIRKVRRDQSHTISLSMSGYKTWSTSFNMESGDKNFNVMLEQE